MARRFAGVDYIECSIGGLSAVDGGPLTIAAVVRLDGLNGGVLDIRTASESVAALSCFGGNFFASCRNGSSFQPIASASTSDGHVLVGWSKADGTVVPRGHKYVYGTNIWSHADAGGTIQDSAAPAGASGVVRLGRCFGDADSFLEGDVAVAAVWTRVLTDAEWQLLPHMLTAWHSAVAGGLWLLDQATTSQAVADLVGSANQTSLTGTTVSAISVPGLSYGHPIPVVAHVADAAPPSAAGPNRPWTAQQARPSRYTTTTRGGRATATTPVGRSRG